MECERTSSGTSVAVYGQITGKLDAAGQFSFTLFSSGLLFAISATILVERSDGGFPLAEVEAELDWPEPPLPDVDLLEPPHPASSTQMRAIDPAAGKRLK